MLGLQIKEFLNHVCEQIKYKPICKEIEKEMENHLLEAKENYMLEGMLETEAEEAAIRQMGNAEEIGKKLNKIHCPKLDWKLLLITLILLLFGALVTFTRATNCWNYMDDTGRVPYGASMSRYIFTVLAGVIVSIGFYFFDYRKIFRFSNGLYIIATMLVILAPKFGLQVNGVKSYIMIAGFNLFVPMLVLPLYIMAFIGFIQNIDTNKNLKMNFLEKKEIRIPFDIFKIVFLSISSLFLLEIIPATAPMVILAMVYLILATVKLLEGSKKRKSYIAILWGVPILLAILLIPMIGHRLVASFAPEQDPMGRGWLGMQQNIILESANLVGEANHMSNALQIFDEGTNFAFISVLAHYGWIVSIGMVLAIVAFSIKLMINSKKMKDRDGKLIVVGIASLFILQSVFNLLMNVNFGIKSNVNIPFISYGRQDLVMNMVCLALVLSVYRRKDILESKGRRI